MSTINTLRLAVEAQTQQFDAAMKGVRAQLKAFESQALALKTAVVGFAVGFAGQAIAGEIGSAVVAASDLNEQISKSRVVFGDASSAVEADAAAMAEAFGVSKREFIDAASSIGLIGKASGLTKGEAAELGTQFARLAIDASSFYNVPLEEALMAMRSGLVGEAEPMRRFGVLLNEAAVKTEAVRLGIAKFGAELTEAQKVQARVSLITKGLADAQGDMARTASGAANQMRALSGRMENFKADAGAAIQPVTDQILQLANVAMKVLGREIAANKDAIKDWAQRTEDSGLGVMAVFERIGTTLGGVADAAQVVNQAVASFEVSALRVNSAFALLSDDVNRALGETTHYYEQAEVILNEAISDFQRLQNQPWNSDRIKKFFGDVRAEAARTRAFAGLEFDAGKRHKKVPGGGGAAAAMPNVKALKEQARDAEKLKDQLRDAFREWSLGIETVNAKTPRQKTILELFVRGVDPSVILGLQALDRQLTELEKKAEHDQGLKDRAKAIIEATRTPLEKFKQEAAELDEMLKKGLLTQEQYNRAVLEAGKDVLPQPGERSGPGHAAALHAGSTEARSQILAFRQGGEGVASKQLTTQQAMLKELQKLNGRRVPQPMDDRQKPDAMGDRPRTAREAFSALVGGGAPA